jgi:hypothetical protein
MAMMAITVVLILCFILFLNFKDELLSLQSCPIACKAVVELSLLVAKVNIISVSCPSGVLKMLKSGWKILTVSVGKNLRFRRVKHISFGKKDER